MKLLTILLTLSLGTLTAFDVQTRLRAYFPVGNDAPGGFVEAYTTTPSRGQLDAAAIAAFMPTTRGVFTFPSPYNTKAWRITDTTDCTGDCLSFGYSVWYRLNNSTGENLLRVIAPLAKSVGGGGLTLFTINKTTDEVLKVGAIFSGANTLSDAQCEQCTWSLTNKDKFYIQNDDPMSPSVWKTLERCDVSGGLPIASCTVVADMTSAAAITAFGSGRKLRQTTSSADDNIHGFIVSNAGSDVGCGVRNESANTYKYYVAHTAGQADVCSPSKNGQYLFMYDQLAGVAEIRFIKLSDDTELACPFAADGCSPGHWDVGWDLIIQNDSWQSTPAWSYTRTGVDPPGSTETIVYRDPAWSYISTNHVTYANATGIATANTMACASWTQTANGPRGNELQCFRLNTDLNILVVAPIMGDTAASCQSNPYGCAPFASISPDGNYLYWAANLHGTRMHAFVVWIPKGLLGLSPPPPAPAPLTLLDRAWRALGLRSPARHTAPK